MIQFATFVLTAERAAEDIRHRPAIARQPRRRPGGGWAGRLCAVRRDQRPGRDRPPVLTGRVSHAGEGL